MTFEIPREREEQRRALRDATFNMRYSPNPESNARAAKLLRNFDEETRRLYPEATERRDAIGRRGRWNRTVGEAQDFYALLGSPTIMSGDDRPRGENR